MAAGFLLNNELTDFSFETHDADGWPIANAIAPGKRPLSSMSPTIVSKDGEPFMVIGSPGGARIIGYVAQTLLGLLGHEVRWSDGEVSVTPAAAVEEMPSTVLNHRISQAKGRKNSAAPTIKPVERSKLRRLATTTPSTAPGKIPCDRLSAKKTRLPMTIKVPTKPDKHPTAMASRRGIRRISGSR